MILIKSALIIVFIHVSFMEGMFLYKFREWLEWDELPGYIKKPLYDCLTCMTSIWGTILWFGFGGGFEVGFFLYILLLGGILALVDNFMNK